MERTETGIEVAD